MSRKNKLSHKLGDVVSRELGIELDKTHQSAEWGGDLTEEMLAYAASDTKVLLPLAEKLHDRVEEVGLTKVMETERRALPALCWMEGAGMPFDAQGWEEHLEGLWAEKERLGAELAALAPDHPDGKAWNWNSWQQILKAFELLDIDLPDTKEETLSRCDHPLARTLLEYRKVSKVLGTYGPSLLARVEGGRIYPSWHQVGADTGRMACSNPNLQNLPPEVRKCVKAPEGRTLVKADYSQIELRIAAKISGDERMLEAFARGEDIHEITARSLTGREEVTKEERKLAKAVNFGLVYGMSPGGLRHYARNNYGVEMSTAEAERYWQDFFETYPGLKRWHDREYREFKKNGNTETRTLAGRLRTGVTKVTERLNSPVQGTGADGLKLALALLWERRHECPGAVPVLAVHDEIVVECEEADAEKVEAWLTRAMIEGMDEVLNASSLGGAHVSVEVETYIGATWA